MLHKHIATCRHFIVHHHKYAWVLMGFAILVVGGVYFKKEFISATTANTFTQSSWTGGVSTSTANHADNQTLWNNYSATSTGISVGNTVALSVTAILGTTGFEFGATSTTQVTGTGVVARVGLGGGTCASTGGIITRVGGYCIHTFTGSDTFTPSVAGNVQALVVAGGGGGGVGGGGGGGAVHYLSSMAVSAVPLSVTVGDGGAHNTKGDNSVFNGQTAEGGGYGGVVNQVGGPGGSGGGGGINTGIGCTISGGAGSPGYNGGATTCVGQSPAGGGGGMGSVGQDGPPSEADYRAGSGGSGIANSISGESQNYAGGGGGSAYGVGAGFGRDGGGNGVSGTGIGLGLNGTINTGGGGGGGPYGGTGGVGGSGVVIIKYVPVTSGTFTSAIIDLTTQVPNPTLSWTSTTTASTTISMEVQTSVNNSTWSGYSPIANGAGTAPGVGVQYVQYRATLSTTDTAITPTLNSVTVNAHVYTPGDITSSVYDTGLIDNGISKVAWTADSITSTEYIRFQVRSASTTEGLDTALWCGQADTASSTCSGLNFFTATSGITMAPGTHPLNTGSDDQYFQYKASFICGFGLLTLTSVTITYGDEPPIITASVLGDNYTSAQSVSLSTNEPATIYYTTDGTNPAASSTEYTNAIPISIATTLKYFGIDTLGNPSTVITQIYTFNTTRPPTHSGGSSFMSVNRQQVPPAPVSVVPGCVAGDTYSELTGSDCFPALVQESAPVPKLALAPKPMPATVSQPTVEPVLTPEPTPVSEVKQNFVTKVVSNITTTITSTISTVMEYLSSILISIWGWFGK